MTDTFTVNPNARLRAEEAAKYLSHAQGQPYTMMTFAEWNNHLGNTAPAVGEADDTTQIDFGQWVAVATGWMGYVASDVLARLFQLGMTTTEGFDDAARGLVARFARAEKPEKKSVQEWWEYLRLAGDKYMPRFASEVGGEPVPLNVLLNGILQTDLPIQVWYARLRSLSPAQ